MILIMPFVLDFAVMSLKLNCSVIGVLILSLVSLQGLLSEPADAGLHAICGMGPIQVICDRATPQRLVSS